MFHSCARVSVCVFFWHDKRLLLHAERKVHNKNSTKHYKSICKDPMYSDKE